MNKDMFKDSNGIKIIKRAALYGPIQIEQCL